jgi:hypothetical protein
VNQKRGKWVSELGELECCCDEMGGNASSKGQKKTKTKTKKKKKTKKKTKKKQKKTS